MVEHNYYVSAYRILYSDDGQKWTVYRETGVEQDKVKRNITTDVFNICLKWVCQEFPELSFGLPLPSSGYFRCFYLFAFCFK